MEIEQKKSIIEAILFAAGRPVSKNEFVLALELPEEDIENIINKNFQIIVNLLSILIKL